MAEVSSVTTGSHQFKLGDVITMKGFRGQRTRRGTVIGTNAITVTVRWQTRWERIVELLKRGLVAIIATAIFIGLLSLVGSIH